MSLNITKEELEEMYWGEPGTELGAPTIARMIGCSKTTIYNYMKKYGISRRPPTSEGTGECFTQNTRSQLSENMKGTFGGKEDVSGENHPNYGEHLSEETKKKIIENRRSYKGEKNPFYGKNHSQKAINKIAETHKGEIHSLKQLETLRTNNLGKKFSEEHKRKISESVKKTKRENSKLTKQIGLKIIKEYNGKNITYKKIAKKYNISIALVGKIINCKHWTTEHLVE